MRATVFVGASLDGFIARPNGDLDWLGDGSFDGRSEDYGYKALVDSVDALVMGRKTYDKALTFGDWPYGKKPVVVLSRKGVAIPKSIAGSVECMCASPADAVRLLSGRGARHLYVDGGQTIQGFLSAGLITDIVITRLPILIGSGIPLFGALPGDVKLRHVATRHFPSGLVQSSYEVMS